MPISLEQFTQSESEITEDITQATVFGAYVAAGRNIFEIGPRLAELFEHTDLGSTTLEMWRAPYPCFFIAWPLLPELRVRTDGPVDIYLDGAFVLAAPNGTESHWGLTLHFSERAGDGRPISTPGYSLALDQQACKLPVVQAIERADFAAGAIAKDADNPLNSAFLAAFHAHHEASKAAAKAAATLLVHALYYIASPDEKEDPWEAEPDPRAEARARSATDLRSPPTAIRTSLAEDGYAIRKLLARDLERGPPTQVGGGRTVRSHWRIGHYRDQPYGEGRTRIKRIWIRPVLVNADEGPPQEGRILKVE